MSASIHYRIVKPDDTFHFQHYGSGSWFKRVLEETFHRTLPAVFDISDLPELRAMSNTYTEKNGFKEMVDQIEKSGAIEVWAEY